MTYSSRKVTVTTTRTRLDTGSSPRTVLVRVEGDVLIGGATVTAATGVPLKDGEDFGDEMAGADGLYAITATATARCYVLQKV